MSRLPRIVALLVTVVLLAATPGVFAVVVDPPVKNTIDVIDPDLRNIVLGTGSAPIEPVVPIPTLEAVETSAAAFEGQRLEFRVRLAPGNGAPDTALVFNWFIRPDEADGAQEGSDYDESSGRGTIEPGATEGTFSIPTLVNDQASEPRSLFVYASLEGGESISLTGTILDRPAIAVEDAARVTEGEPLVFHVEMDRPVELPVTYRWQVTDGLGWLADGLPTGGERTIAPGQRGDTISLTTRNDEMENGSRHMTVTISAEGMAPVEASGEIVDTIAGDGDGGGGGETGRSPGPIHYIAAILVAILVGFGGWKLFRRAPDAPDPLPVGPHLPGPEPAPTPTPPFELSAVARAGAAAVTPIELRPEVPPIELVAIAGMARFGPMTAVLVEEGVDDG